MSWACGTTERVTGGWLASAYPGLGATGAQIKAATASGAHGAGPLFNDGLADASEYYWRIHTPPASGTLVPYEIGSFEHTGAANGSWPWTYDIWEDGTKLIGAQPDGSTLVTTLVGVAALALLAANCTQANTSSTGAVSFSGGGLSLAAANCTQANASSSGAVTFAAAALVLAAANCTQANSCSTGAVMLVDVGPAPTLQPGKRRVMVGSAVAPAKLQRMDVQDVDDITFDHTAALLPGETIASAVVTAEVALGADDNPAGALQYATQVSGPLALQRVRGRVSGVTYMLRSIAVLSSGRQLVGAAFLPIVKLR